MNIDLLLRHATTLITTPRDVAKLRQTILTLAVQGKLVPQEAGDEPAEVLLNSILLHKQNSKQSAQSQATQLPFAIPSNWICVPFGQIMINRDGERIPVSKEERDTRAKIYDYYGASGVIDKIDSYLFDKPLLLIGEDGANLINRSTPIAFIARGKYWVNNHAHVLDAYNEDLLRYIEIYINSIDLKPYVTGTAQPKMNQQKMNTIPVPLPPLAEQRRIVARVDELMAICDTLEAQLQARAHMQARVVQAALARVQADPSPASIATLLDPKIGTSPADLRQMILTLAVQGKLVPQEAGDEPAEVFLKRIWSNIHDNRHELFIDEKPAIYDLPNNWYWVYFGEIINFTIGKTPSRNNTDYWSNGLYPWVSIADMNHNHVINETKEKVSALAHDEIFRGKIAERGSILMSFKLTIGKISRAMVNCFHNEAIISFKPPEDELSDYLFKILPIVVNWQTSNSAVMGSTLNKDLLRKIPIPLPPLAEQRRIVARVDELMALVDRLEAQQTQANTLGAQVLDALVGGG